MLLFGKWCHLQRDAQMFIKKTKELTEQPPDILLACQIKIEATLE